MSSLSSPARNHHIRFFLHLFKSTLFSFYQLLRPSSTRMANLNNEVPKLKLNDGTSIPVVLTPLHTYEYSNMTKKGLPSWLTVLERHCTRSQTLTRSIV